MTKEDVLQIQVVNYLKMQHKKAFYFHSPNGGKRNAREALKFKKMGVLSGLPDLMFLDSTFNYCGLAIELKIKPNKPTENQLEQIKRLQNLGFKTAICYSFEEAKNEIDNYYKFVK